MAQRRTSRKTLMRWIVGTSLNYRFLVVAIGALLMVLGVVTLPSTRVDVFPEFAPPRGGHPDRLPGPVHLRRRAAGHRAAGAGLNGVDGLDDMRSKSVPQLSAIELIFDSDVDELKARQLVRSGWTAVAPHCRPGPRRR